MNLEQLCNSVNIIAREAGSFIREEGKKFKSSSIEHKGMNDLVSYVDKNAEQMIVNSLQPLIEDAGFITEENTSNITGKRYQWIIDPLDGTTNFVHGLPPYCVSIGLTDNGKLCLGVIYEINLDECFYAWRNGGAWMNGKRIYVSEKNALNDSLLATGFPYTNFSRMKPYMEVFDYCMRYTHGLRRLGSAAVDIAYVACGRFEGFYEYGLNAWDVAAGAFIVEEAGGKVCDFNGGDNFLFGKEIITTNKGIYEEFLEVVKEKFSA